MLRRRRRGPLPSVRSPRNPGAHLSTPSAGSRLFPEDAASCLTVLHVLRPCATHVCALRPAGCALQLLPEPVGQPWGLRAPRASADPHRPSSGRRHAVFTRTTACYGLNRVSPESACGHAPPRTPACGLVCKDAHTRGGTGEHKGRVCGGGGHSQNARRPSPTGTEA